MDVCVLDAVQLQRISKVQNVQSKTTSFSCLEFYCINGVSMMHFLNLCIVKKYTNPKVKVKYYTSPTKALGEATSNFAGAYVT